jgi:hypothetical protein
MNSNLNENILTIPATLVPWLYIEKEKGNKFLKNQRINVFEIFFFFFEFFTYPLSSVDEQPTQKLPP